MKTTKAAIHSFLENRKIAIAGVSRDPKKFGNSVLTKMKQSGFDLYLLHPEAEILYGEHVYKNVSDLPNDIGGILIITPKSETLQLVKDAIAKGIRNIWIQQMSEVPEAEKLALEAGVNLISGQCILMFLEPVTGPHKFHRMLRTWFGKMPK
jgi:uncharacterized protein